MRLRAPKKDTFCGFRLHLLGKRAHAGGSSELDDFEVIVDKNTHTHRQTNTNNYPSGQQYSENPVSIIITGKLGMIMKKCDKHVQKDAFHVQAVFHQKTVVTFYLSEAGGISRMEIMLIGPLQVKSELAAELIHGGTFVT